MMIALPLAILLFSAVLLTLVDGTSRLVGWMAVTAIGLAMLATIALGVQIDRLGPQTMLVGNWPEGIGIALRVDGLGIAFAVLSQFVLLIALAWEVASGLSAPRFAALVMFEAVGLTGAFFTGDAFNFYVFFEISMLTAYVLVSYGETPRQFRAAFIFITVNLLGSVLFVLGIAAIYHTTGFLDMLRIRDQMLIVDENPAILSATLIFVALCVKLGLFPFHFWLPAVYTGTRPAVAAILSGALANIGTYGLLRFGAGVFPRELAQVGPVLIGLGVVSVVYGGHQAISRHNTAEVLAYSAIGQVGYIMLALGIGGDLGLQTVVLYAILNGLNKVILFLAGSTRGWVPGAAFAVGMFSVAGIPPAAGFFGKFALVRLTLADSRYWLVAFLVFGSALSSVYMFQNYRRHTEDFSGRSQGAIAQRAILILLGVLLLGIGVYPEPLLELSQDAARTLLEVTLAWSY